MEIVPRFAATVIVFRDCDATEDDSDFEVLMIKRSENQKFLGGYHAFPGGKLEEEDYSDNILSRCGGLGLEQAYNILYDQRTFFTDKRIALGFWITAIRELFEEMGILLVYKNGNLINLSSSKIKKYFEDYRIQIMNGKGTFHKIMEREDLVYAVDKLRYFRHFITPPIMPRRYDTRFFIAKLPQGQDLKPFDKEIASFDWMTPKKALRKFRKREIKIIAPQFACLKALKKVENICNLTRS
ncbi:MAG: NUDIX hydrolase [Candidatus Helarchaeota archaeon]